MFGAMDLSTARELMALKDANARLKKVVAYLSLKDAMLQDIASKMGEEPASPPWSDFRSPRSLPVRVLNR